MELGAKGIMKIELSQQEVADMRFFAQAAGLNALLGDRAYKKVTGLPPEKLKKLSDFVSSLANAKLAYDPEEGE